MRWIRFQRVEPVRNPSTFLSIWRYFFETVHLSFFFTVGFSYRLLNSFYFGNFLHNFLYIAK